MSRKASVPFVLACLAIAGCGGGSHSRAPGHGSGGKPGKTESGRFVLTMRPPISDDDKQAAQLLKATGVVGEVLKSINENIALPNDVNVVIQPGNDGPAYDPEYRTLVIGYPFVSYVAGVFNQADPNISAEELASRTVNVVAFVLLHEMGHALVDQLKLPVTGKEEDSVDNLASVITGSDPEASQIALDFANFFALLQKNPNELSAVDFWDEHSLDIQRANQAVCLIYGSDPKKHSDLANVIAPERRDRCPQEWKQISNSWDQLLAPYSRR